MNYSCFDAHSGDYRYFADDRRLPLNADLPVPKLPPVAGKVGVPAREAGRPLPPSAKEVGRGQQARGLIVRCDGGALSGWWDELNSSSKRNVAVGVVAALGLLAAALLMTEEKPFWKD